ncbi:MAG: glycosyltransferase family 39 protein, partial [Myxococcota bacterium]|nr:glycosyltransferase family 39 protein [Myxococcota bacterium]
ARVLRTVATDVAALGLLAVPVIFLGLGSYSPMQMDEVFYHGVAQEMLASGDFLRITFRGEARPYDALLNAPIHYWAKAGVIALVGDHLWSMRLPAACFGLLTVWGVYFAVRRIESRRAGLLAALLLLTTFQFIYLHGARNGDLESLLAFGFLFAAVLFLRGAEGRGGFLGHHLCLIAVAHLKLPLAGVILLAELVWFWLTPEARPYLRRYVRVGLWLLPVALAWRIHQVVTHPDVALEVVNTMLSQAAGVDGETARGGGRRFGNLGYYLRALFFGAFPHVLVFPLAVFAVLRAPRDARSAARWRLFALNAGALLAFFLVVAKRFPWYVIPVYAFLCAFAGAWLDRLLGHRASRGLCVALGVAAALACWVQMPGLDYDPFATAPHRLPEMGGAHIGGVTPWVGVPLTAALVAGGLLAWRGRGLATGLAALLLFLGGARVLAPLRFTDFDSRLVTLRTEVDSARARGESLPRPIVYEKDPGEGGNLRIQYYFAEDFWVVPLRDASGRSRVVELWDRERGRPPDS